MKTLYSSESTDIAGRLSDATIAERVLSKLVPWMGSWGAGVGSQQIDASSDESNGKMQTYKDRKGNSARKFPPTESEIRSLTAEAKRQIKLLNEICKEEETISGEGATRSEDKSRLHLSEESSLAKNKKELTVKIDADEHVIPTLITVMRKFLNRDADITVKHITEVLVNVHVLLSNNDAAKRVFLLQGGYEVYQKLPSVFEDLQCADGGRYAINLLELFSTICSL